MTIEEIKDFYNKPIEIFVDGKKVNQADFLSETPTSIKMEENIVKIFFEME